MQAKERIKNIDKSMYFTKANLHTHSTFSDGKTDFDELIEQAKKMGLEHLAICDHNTAMGYKNSKYANDPILIPAVEFDCISGHALMHILGYGVDFENEELKKYLSIYKYDSVGDIRRVFGARNPKKVIDAIHLAGGIAVLAHPCCCYVLNLENFIKKLANMGLDGVEVYYPYRRHRGIIKFHSRVHAKQIAEKFNLIMTGGTDEHGILKY